MYKVTEGHAPFPKNDDSVKAIISAGSWDELAGLFGQQGTESLLSSSPAIIPMSQSVKKGIYEGCHMFAGFLLVLGNSVLALEAEDQSGSLIIGVPAGVIGFLCAAVNGVGDLLVPLDAIENWFFKKLSTITTMAVVSCKLVFSGVGQFAFQKFKINKMVIEDARSIGAFLNGILTFHGTVVTLWHFYELMGQPDNKERTAAILGEVANVASYFSRLSYGMAVNDEEPDSRVVAILAMGVFNDTVAGLQIAQGAVGGAALS